MRVQRGRALAGAGGGGGRARGGGAGGRATGADRDRQQPVRARCAPAPPANPSCGVPSSRFCCERFSQPGARRPDRSWLCAELAAALRAAKVRDHGARCVAQCKVKDRQKKANERQRMVHRRQ